jgi:hypothetical protein
VKALKLPNNKDRERLINEESCEYWDEHDSSEILETGERIKLEIARPEYVCERCRSSRIRRRIIDIPILSGKVVLKRMKTFYCADCRTSLVQEESLKELRDEFRHLATLDANTILSSVKEALTFHDKKWKEKANERKVISVYFPTKEGIPAKAQISLVVSDPLYPRLRSLTSEAVRNMLGLQYFEDLEREASGQHRTISQYLKLELAKLLLNDSSKPNVEKASELRKEEHLHSRARILTIVPRKVDRTYLADQSNAQEQLAARTQERGEIYLLETDDKTFVGILKHDYSEASLFVDVVKNAISLNVFDVELFMNDKEVVNREGLRIQDNRILLLSETEYTSPSVSKIVIKTKNGEQDGRE